MLHLIGDTINPGVSNLMGIASNYLMFIFVNALVFISIRYTHLFGVLHTLKSDHDSAPEFTPEQVQRVERLMNEAHAYLEPDSSAESLARRPALPERTMSRILNQHFGQSFFELINS